MKNTAEHSLKQLRLECLVLAQSFETFWAYYIQSDGQLFANECRSAARDLLEVHADLAKRDPTIVDPVALRLGANWDVEGEIGKFREWAFQQEQPYPFSTPFKSRFMLFIHLAGLKTLLIKALNLKRFPQIILSSDEIEHSERSVRWRGHLPAKALRNEPDDLVKKASHTQTIVVVGDIRRSQDLMTYSSSAADFSQRMVQFIETTRTLIENQGGIFDKFTGDGFVAYFNETITQFYKTTPVAAFLSFAREELAFCKTHFHKWTRSIRKLPSQSVGLSIGADVGTVAYQDMHHHLVAVGSPIVWASRMASIGSAQEIIVNNLLHALLERERGIAFVDRVGRTKAGESFLAHALSLKGR